MSGKENGKYAKCSLMLVFTVMLLLPAVTLTHNVFADQVITTIPIQGVPIGLGVNSATHMIYVGTSYDPSHSDKVYVINGATNNVTSTIQGGQGHRDISVNSNTNMIYVVNFGYYSTSYRLICDNTVSVINGTTNSVQSTIPVGNCPIAVGVNPITNMIYVANSNDNTVSVINGTTNSVQSTIPVGNSPNGVGVNLNTDMIYVTNFGNILSVINGTTNSVQSTIPVGNSPNGVGVNPNTNMIYVANSNDNTVSVINGTTNSVQSTIPVGKVPFAVGVNPNTNKIYVGNAVDNTLSIINGVTNSVESTISVNNPWDIDVDLNTNMIYVADNAGNTVSVISGSVPISPPQSPTNLTASTISSSQINLSWTAPNDNGGSSITGYKIERSTDNGTTWSVIVPNTALTSTTYNDTGLTHSTTYSYRVSAINSVGTSSSSNTASATTLNTAPSSPTSLTATGKVTNMTLSWNAPTDNGGLQIVGYMIERSVDNGTTWSTIISDTNSTGTTYTDSHLMPVKTYTYRVSAINQIGTSDFSNTISAKPLSIPHLTNISQEDKVHSK